MGGAVMRKLLPAMAVAAALVAAISRTNEPRKAQRKEEK
jgi:hypothetical protein